MLSPSCAHPKHIHEPNREVIIYISVLKVQLPIREQLAHLRCNELMTTIHRLNSKLLVVVYGSVLGDGVIYVDYLWCTNEAHATRPPVRAIEAQARSVTSVNPS